MVQDQLAGEIEQVAVQTVEEGRNQNQGQVVGRHLVDLRERLDPDGMTAGVRRQKKKQKKTFSLFRRVIKTSSFCLFRLLVCRRSSGMMFLQADSHVEVSKQGVERDSLRRGQLPEQASVGGEPGAFIWNGFTHKVQ